MIKVEFSPQELQATIDLIHIAVKAEGLNISEAATSIAKMLATARQEQIKVQEDTNTAVEGEVINASDIPSEK